jgi:imidazolonepropionase-like amidohydrolase
VLAQAPAEVRADWQELAEGWRSGQQLRDPLFARFSLDLVTRFHAAGVPLGAGTDTPIGVALPGYSLHTELERFVDAGLTPLEALATATVRPAEFFGLADEMGTIEVGRRADLVLLGANPLDDIRNTRKVVGVVSKGRVVDPVGSASSAEAH